MSEKIILMKFSADWCQPCKLLTKTLVKVLDTRFPQIEVREIDVAKDGATANAHAVRSLPTLICNGRRLQGNVPEASLIKWLEDCVNG